MSGDRTSFLGGLFKVVIVLGLLVAVAGYFLGWFTFSTSRKESGDQSKVDLTVTVNKDEIKRDTGRLKHKFSELKDSAESSSKVETVEGKVKSVNIDKREVVLQPMDSDKTTTVKVDDKTEFKLGEAKSSLKDLKEGERIVVTYKKTTNAHLAKSVSLAESGT